MGGGTGHKHLIHCSFADGDAGGGEEVIDLYGGGKGELDFFVMKELARK